MKVDGKVQSLLLADPEEFEKVFMPGLGNKLFYMYSNNVFSPGKLFVLFSVMLLVFACVLKTLFKINYQLFFLSINLLTILFLFKSNFACLISG